MWGSVEKVMFNKPKKVGKEEIDNLQSHYFHGTAIGECPEPEHVRCPVDGASSGKRQHTESGDV